MDENLLGTALSKGLLGIGATADEALRVASLPSSRLFDVLAVTDKIRAHHKGVEVDLCAIVNAKSGLCAEDCTFCAQSSRYETGVEERPMAGPDDIARAAEHAEAIGAREFSIVTSGTRVAKRADLDALTGALRAMREKTGVERCASLGILSAEVLKELKDSGLESYHHNLETGRSFFKNICTTHDYEDDVEVVRTAKALGFHVCSGGLFGLGEGWAERVELAETLRELDVDSVPINFLNPRPGTPLKDSRNLTPVECLMIIAVFRLMMPAKEIIVCGGREVNLRDLQPLIFAAGANGMMVGDYLTTRGRDAAEDMEMLADLGLRPRGR